MLPLLPNPETVVLEKLQTKVLSFGEAVLSVQILMKN
jgi:hypothetical protein